jgi:hypothetical protein
MTGSSSIRKIVNSEVLDGIAEALFSCRPVVLCPMTIALSRKLLQNRFLTALGQLFVRFRSKADFLVGFPVSVLLPKAT